ncbi:tripartite tricarboxylate transporter TctB family protein [Bacillus sp. JJ1503]|uniref:tripartite tricarboxylate transporter TctB family protein n=1 Tax=Bacillus sp. JJ1503 TaxID=3122956 RepID=UPI002FFDAD6C
MRINKDFILSATVLTFGLFFVIGSFSFPAGDHLLNSSRSFPMLLGYSFMGLAIWQFIKTIREKKANTKEFFSRLEIKRGFVFIFLTVAYIFVLIPLLGFMISTLLFLFVGILFYKEIRWYTASLVSIGMIGFIYLIFVQLMNIRLP